MKFTGERFLPSLLSPEIVYEHWHRYLYASLFVAGKKVLDVACGEGYGSALLAEHASMVVGVDISSESVELAHKKYGKDNLQFIVGDITTLPLSSEKFQFDIIVSFETIEHVNENAQLKFLNGIISFLKPDGLFIISTPNKLHYSDQRNYKNEFHIKEFYSDEFRYFLRKYFLYVHFIGQKVMTSSILVPIDYETQSATNFCINKEKDLFRVEPEGLKKFNKEDYIVAFCSNSSIQSSPLSILIDNDNSLMFEKNSILESRQKEIEELSSWGQKLDRELIETGKLLCKKNEEIEKLSSWGKQLSSEFEPLKKKNMILENELNHIYGTKQWRYSTKAINILKKIKLLPFLEGLIASRRKGWVGFKEKLFEISEANEQLCTITLEDEVLPDQLVVPKFDRCEVAVVIISTGNIQTLKHSISSLVKNTKEMKYCVDIFCPPEQELSIRESDINNVTISSYEEKTFWNDFSSKYSRHHAGTIAIFSGEIGCGEDCLKKLSEVITDNPDVALVGPKIVNCQIKIHSAGIVVDNNGKLIPYGSGEDPSLPEYNYFKEVDALPPACCMISQKYLQECSSNKTLPFWTPYGIADFAFDIRSKDMRVVYQPKSQVTFFTEQDFADASDEFRDAFVDRWSDLIENTDIKLPSDVFRARDRSQGKDVVVVVDHYVPDYDRNAGARCTFQYLKLFVELGLNVKFIPDNFHQFEPYCSMLENLGIEVLYGNKYKLEWQDWIARYADCINYFYLQRPHISIKYIDLFKKYPKSKVFYFAHDLHHISRLRQYEIDKNAITLKTAEEFKKMEFELFEKADVVHVVGDFEKKYVEQQFPAKAVRNIPLYIFENFDLSPNYSFEDRENLLFVGGFGHPPNCDAVLWFINEIFPLIRSEKPEVRLTVAGSNPPNEIIKLDSAHVKIAGYVTDMELENLFRKSRVMVVPLRYGAGVKGKILEAMYFGLPVVTTPIGAEGLIGAENILQVDDSPAKFAKLVLRCYQDEDYSRKISEESFKYIKDNFSKEKAIEILSMDFDLSNSCF